MVQQKHVFIVGCKGIPANYGGYETFVDELVSRKRKNNIHYHVACMNAGEDYVYNGAKCFSVSVPNIGPAKAVYYDIVALKRIVKTIREKKYQNGIVYVLACRIGPFFRKYVTALHKLGFRVYVNPDGHEWKRAKWNYFIKKYWKYSEKLMVKHADLLICDSVNIERYIQEEYSKYQPKTTFIAYGADVAKSELKNDSKELQDWYQKFNIKANEYYLIVGRFVPENNYEIVIREFMKSNSKKDLVIITNVSQNRFYEKLKKITHFEQDKRVKFVGTVYDKQLIKKIRENAFGYFHGHEVGGTNPSLLEALASTKLNLLLDVGFNREVAEDGAVYWTKKFGQLTHLIEKVEELSEQEIQNISEKAQNRITMEYIWGKIILKYETLFRGSNHESE